MAHFPKPFFKKARSAWYVQLDGKQIKLAPDKDLAFERYHQLMQARCRTGAACTRAT
jgi:integrase/recombinase XerD